MIIFNKKMGICLIILFISFIGSGCNKSSDGKFVKLESKYDQLFKNDNETAANHYGNNVVYLGEDSKDSKRFGPNDVSFDFYALKR